jgi:hypothetical protein
MEASRKRDGGRALCFLSKRKRGIVVRHHEWIFVLLQSLLPRRRGEEGNGRKRLVAKREGGGNHKPNDWGGGSCFGAEYICQ